MSVSPQPPRRICFAVLIIAVPLLPLCGEKDRDAAAGLGEWQAILEEAEETIDWASDPTGDLGLDLPEEVPDLLVSVSLATGIGYSDNFLKGSDPMGSAYARLETSGWLNWLRDRNTFTALLVFEGTMFEAGEDVSDEFILFSQGSWTRSVDRLDVGTELELFYGDQIYEATLIIGDGHSGDRLRQFRPGSRLFLDWYPGKRERLRLALDLRRAEYDLASENNWQPGAGTEWEHLWLKGLVTETRIFVARQFYDEEIGRNPYGLPLPGSLPLEVNRFSLEQRIEWEPARLGWLELDLSAGAAWEEDRVGTYESLRHRWASAGGRISAAWGSLRAYGRWLEIDYAERLYNGRPIEQTQRSLRLEYRYKLPWDLALQIRAQYTRFSSPLPDESYRERRVESMLEWSY